MLSRDLLEKHVNQKYEMYFYDKLTGNIIGNINTTETSFTQNNMDDLTIKYNDIINKQNKEVSFSVDCASINQYSLMKLIGFEFIESEFMTERIQNKTHHKKRINKKWRKKYGFKDLPKKQNRKENYWAS